MDYNKLPSNSFDQGKPSANETPPKVANGRLDTTKSEGKKIARALIGGSLEDIKSHTIYDVIIPGIKKIVLDAISLLLFGTTTNAKVGGSTTRVSYDSFWNKGINQPIKASSVGAATNSNAQFDYADPVFETSEEAEKLRNDVMDWVDRKGAITVSQFYQMAGITGYPFTFNNFGWKGVSTIANSTIVSKTSNGDVCYILKMPRISALNASDWQ